MTYDSSNAEDSCLKNHPRRPGQANDDDSVPSAGTPREVSGMAGRDLPHDSEKTLVLDNGVFRGPAVGGGEDGGGEGTGEEGRTGGERGDGGEGGLETTTPLARVETNLDFPEGGLGAWLVVFGSFCAMLCVFGLINTAAVFESYFSTNQLSDHSSSEIGWIFSLYLFIVFFVGIQVGPIFDKYGPRIVVPLGVLLIAASLLILSVCEGRLIIPIVARERTGLRWRGGLCLVPRCRGVMGKVG